MKNGFTLVELLAIIVLLGIIIVVAVPSLIQSNKIAGEKNEENLASVINNACESYIAISDEDMKEKILNDDEHVTVKMLVENGFVKESTVKDISNTEAPIPITYNDNEITCNYSN